MSGGNQQKAIVAREIDKYPELFVAVQPTRGLDVGAIEYIHKQLVAQRDAGKAVLLVSLNWTRSWTCRTAFSSCTRARSSANSIQKSTTQEELGPTWLAPREMR